MTYRIPSSIVVALPYIDAVSRCDQMVVFEMDLQGTTIRRRYYYVDAGADLELIAKAVMATIMEALRAQIRQS